MATQVEALETVSATKPEREDKELLNEITSVTFFPDEAKKLESKPNQSLEASNYEEQTVNIPVAIKYEVDQEKTVTEAGMGTNQGETFLNSPPIPEVATNDSSSTLKENEATRIKDQAEELEIETLEEDILKDQRVDIVVSKEADEQRPVTEDKLEKSQKVEREYVMDELEQGERLSESSSIEETEVWLNDKENEGPNVDDTVESIAKRIEKKENFKGQLLESAGEETGNNSQEEDATKQKGEDIESVDAIADVIEVEMVENKIDSQDLVSNTDDITAKGSQEDETAKETPKQEVPRISNEGAAETEVQKIEQDSGTNLGPSAAGEEMNEANLKQEQEESDLEVKNLDMESIQNIDTKSHVEAQASRGLLEEVHEKESNEDVVVSSSMPQVSQKETEDDNLGKAESATTELAEETSIKEVEQESNSSDLLLEEKSRAIEVASDDVNIIAEHSEVTEIVENTNIQISETTKSEADEAGEETVCEVEAKTYTTVPKGEDERELTSGETSAEQTLEESSAPSVTESQLGTTEDILKGPSIDDTEESTAKQIAENKGQLLESTGEEKVSYSQEEDTSEQKGVESFDAIEDITEVEKVENKIDSRDLESNMDDIIAKSSQEDETTRETPEEEVPRISNEGAAEIEVQVIEQDNTANFEPSAVEESTGPNLKREQKESDIEVNSTNKEIEEQKTEESANNTDLPSIATGEENVNEYLKEDETDEVKPKEEVKNNETDSMQNIDTKSHVEEEIHQKESNEDVVVSSSMPQVPQKETEDDNLDKAEIAIAELIEERSIKEVEQKSNNSDLLLEEKTYAKISKGDDERELTSGEMSISYLLEQTLEESLAPSETESQPGTTEVSETIDGNTEIMENSNNSVQSLVTAEKTEEKLEKKENEPVDPIEDTLVELKDIQMDDVNAEENPESVGPLELGSPVVLVAEEKSNETYPEINQTKTDDDKENVNTQNLETAEEEVSLASDTTSEERISGEISEKGQNETEEVEPKSEAEPQINKAEYSIEAINDDVLTEEVLGEAKKAEESELTTSEHADINKEATVVAKPDNDKIEVEELTISDTEPIREITETAKQHDIKCEPEASPIAEEPEVEILEGAEKPINFSISESALSEANTTEENIEESGSHKDEAETAAETSSEEVQLANESTRDLDTAADDNDMGSHITLQDETVDTMELQDSSVISEISAPEHVEINNEPVVVEKPAIDEVVELEISDAKPIIGNTETAELQVVEDTNREAEASSGTKAPEQEIIEGAEKPISIPSSSSELPEQNTRNEKMEEVDNHWDESETTQETVITAETSSEGVELDNVSARNLETSAADNSLGFNGVRQNEVVDGIELQGFSAISQPASTEHADVNKETMIVEESATDEPEVEELEISNAEASIEQIVEKSSAPSVTDSQLGTAEVSDTIDGNTEMIENSNSNVQSLVTAETTEEKLEKKENEPVDAIEDTPVELKNIQMDDENVEEVLGEAEKAEESTYINEQITEESCVTKLQKTSSSDQEPNKVTSSVLDSTENREAAAITDNATIEELEEIENTNWEPGASSIAKAPEEEKMEGAEKPVIITRSASEPSEENIEEVGNHEDEAEIAVDTMELQDSSVISELTTPEHAEMNKESVVVEESATDEVEELKVSDVKPIIVNTETAELQAVGDINQEAEASSLTKAPEEEIMESVDSLELQDSSVISKLASVEHADINKETMVVEESATDETEVEELEISNAETNSYAQNGHPINESEKISTVDTDRNTYKEETSEVLESKSEAKYQVVEAVAEGNKVPEPTHPAEDLTEQFQMPSSATLLGEQELQTTTTAEKVEHESPMKEETLVNEKVESTIASNPKEETCLPASGVEISTLDLEILDKNDSPGESSARETEDLQVARAEEPREVLVKSEETEMKEEQTHVAATESREKENMEEKLIKEDETIDDDISSEKTTAGNEDAKDSSVVSPEEVHVQELSKELEAVCENKDYSDESKAVGETYQDLNAAGTDSSSCPQETEKERNVEEAHTRLDLQERDLNDTNVETKSPNQEIEGVTLDNGKAKKIEDIKEEFVEEENCITEVQTTSASEETNNKIAYSDSVTDEKFESKVWSTETEVEELKATEDPNLEVEASSITETSEREIKQGTQKPVDITSSVLEVPVEETGEEEIKEATILHENIDAQPVTLVSETCLEEVQEVEKLIKDSNTENQIEKADEANDTIEDTNSSEKVADDEGVARKSMATDPTEELSEDLPWNGVQGKAEENVAGAGEAIVNPIQDLVVEGTTNENISQDAAVAKNDNELPREVETQETANQTDCVKIGMETIVPSEEITYLDSECKEITEATDLTTGTELENSRAEDLESKSEALADEMSESNENSVNIPSPVVEVPEEVIREERVEANNITDTPPVTLVTETSSEDVQQGEQLIKGSDENAETNEARIRQEDEEVDSVKLEEDSNKVTQITREHAFIGTEEVTAEKPNANEAEEIITSDRSLVSVGQDPKDVFETDKVQEEMNSVPDSITEEKKDVKDAISSASVPIEELCEESRGLDAQEKAEEHNAGVERLFVESCQVSVSEGSANENLPQETVKDKNVNKAPSEFELQATEEESEEKEISTEPIILIEENRETVPHEELITTYEYVAKDQIDEPLPDINSKTEDSKDQNLESTVEKISGHDFQEVQSEMNKEVGHKIEEENEETQGVNETKKDVFLMDDKSREAVVEIQEVEDIVNIKEENTEGGSCTEELKATSESDENSREAVVEIRALEDIVNIKEEITEGGSGTEELKTTSESDENLSKVKYQADETVIEGGKIPDLTHQATNLTEKSYESSPSEMIQRENEWETTTKINKVEDEREKKDGTLVTELEEDSLESRTTESSKELHVSHVEFFELDADKQNENPNEAAREERTVVEEAAVVEPQEDVDNKKIGGSLIPSPMGIQENAGEKCEKDTVQDFQNIEEVLESEVTEIEEVHPKSATIASMEEENQSQIQNEKTRIITKEVSSDKTTLDKEVAEDSLLLSADEEKIKGSCLEGDIKTQDYSGEITNQKLETTMIQIPAEESSHELEKAGEIKNIISLGDRNVSEILPEEIKDENCLNEAPTELNLQERSSETCCRDINTEDKNVIEERNDTELELKQHDKDQAGSTERNNVIPNYEVRSKDFEVSAVADAVSKEATHADEVEIFTVSTESLIQRDQEKAKECLDITQIEGQVDLTEASENTLGVQIQEGPITKTSDDEVEELRAENKSVIEQESNRREIEEEKLMVVEKKEQTDKREDHQSDKAQTDEGEGAQKDEGMEEEEGGENEKVDSGSDGPVMVEVARDVDVKSCKKSHGILSGVGSKVKNSISKVKKVITGKSSQKSSSPK